MDLSFDVLKFEKVQPQSESCKIENFMIEKSNAYMTASSLIETITLYNTHEKLEESKM